VRDVRTLVAEDGAEIHALIQNIREIMSESTTDNPSQIYDPLIHSKD